MYLVTVDKSFGLDFIPFTNVSTMDVAQKPFKPVFIPKIIQIWLGMDHLIFRGGGAGNF